MENIVINSILYSLTVVGLSYLLLVLFLVGVLLVS